MTNYKNYFPCSDYSPAGKKREEKVPETTLGFYDLYE